MSLYPGTPMPRIEQIHSVEKDGYSEQKLTMHLHTGTHIDAPGHIIQGGKLLDEYSLGSFHGKAITIDCRNNASEIGLSVVAAYEGFIGDADFILFCTGWSQYWGTPKYMDYPVLSPDLCRWIAERTIRGVGMDTISPDPIESEALNCHKILMMKEVLIIENLTGLEEIIDKPVEILCFPIAVKSADGAPVRAVARVIL